MKRFARQLIRDHAPPIDAVLHARALRRHFRDEFHARQSVIRQKLYGAEEPTVLSGPFAGLRYLDETVWGPIEPKWIGTYERELHDIVTEVVARRYDTIVDVGSAEGYYSVGLAARLPACAVHSFDTDPWARAQQRRLARLNGVRNVAIGRYCRHRDIDALARGRTLVICDIEGYEYGLLDGGRSAALGQCDILVETHPDGAHPTARQGAEHLSDRFRASHAVEIIEMQDRPRHLAAGLRGLDRLSEAEVEACLDERRDYPQCWLWMPRR